MFKPSIYNILIEQEKYLFLYNSFSKSCIKIKLEEKERILNIINTKEKLISPEQDILLRNGFIVYYDTNELERLEYFYHENYFSESLLNIVLVPTLNCNLSCPYCFERGHREIKPNKRYFDILKNFANKYFYRYNVIQISLFGGEPLLHKDSLIDFLSFVHSNTNIKKQKIFSSIVTNGTLLDSQTVVKLLTNKCISIQVTIDGDKITHDSTRVNKQKTPTFDVIIKNFSNAIETATKINKKCHFILRINLYNQELYKVAHTLQSFNKLLRSKIDVLFRPVYSTKCFKSINTNSFNNLNLFYKLASDLGYGIVQNSYILQQCESGKDKNFFYITPDLKLWKCIGDLGYEKACFGEIQADGTMTVNKSLLADWYKNSNPFKDTDCINCNKLPDCYGGCILNRSKKGIKICKTNDMIVLPNIYSSNSPTNLTE